MALKEYIGSKNIFMEELRWPITVAKESSREFAYQEMLKIYNRANFYMNHSKNEKELMLKVFNDYEVFCIFFRRLNLSDIDGNIQLASMYPTPAQSKITEMISEYDTIYGMFSRQSGKTEWASTYGPFQAIRSEGYMLNLLAPTERQLIVMKNTHDFLSGNEYLRENFVMPNKGGELNKESITFGRNKSRISSMTLSQAHSGDTKRGISGHCIIDEFPLLDKKTIDDLIEPIQSNARIKVKIIYVGTPKLEYNPDIETEMDTLIEAGIAGFIHVNCWENIEFGATARDKISRRFIKFNIPCKYGRTGYCPKFYKDGGTFIPPDPRRASFKCDEVCKNYDSFVMENLAEFPSGSNRVFPKNWLYNNSRADGRLTQPHNIRDVGDRVMSIDLGFVGDPTVILVCDPVLKTGMEEYALRVIGWHEIQSSGDMSRGNDPLREAIQRYYLLYNPNTIYIDITRSREFVYGLVKHGDKLIPRNKFYACEVERKKNSFGVYWANHATKHEMMVNHRSQVQQGNWIVPQNPSEFWSTWFNDHYKTKAEESSDQRYKLYPNTGHTLAAAMQASLWLAGKGRGSPPSLMVL